MEREITLDNLRTMAQLAGLKLADEELQRLLAGVTRSKNKLRNCARLLQPRVNRLQLSMLQTGNRNP